MMNEVGTSLFPPEIFNEILKYSKSSFAPLACVKKQFEILIKDYVQHNPLKGYFGKKEWKNYVGDPGIVCPIPLMFQDFDPLKQMLTFIPETINGALLTLSSIDAFVSNYKHIETIYMELLSNSGIVDETVKENKAHWVLLSKDVMDGTRNKNFEIQEGLVKKQGFEIPYLIDTVVSLLMHNLNTGEFVYPSGSEDHRLVYTRVQEKNKNGCRIVVGGFSTSGLFILSDEEEDNSGGVAYARKSTGA